MTTPQHAASVLVRDLTPVPFQPARGWAHALPEPVRAAIVDVANAVLDAHRPHLRLEGDCIAVTPPEHPDYWRLRALDAEAKVARAEALAEYLSRSPVVDRGYGPETVHEQWPWAANRIRQALEGSCCGDGPDGQSAARPERPRATPTRDDVAAAILGRYPSFDPITARALADVVAPLYEGTRP